MKTVQKFFVFGMLMTAGLIFAGCGDTGAGGGTTTTPAETEGGGSGSTEEASEGSDAASLDAASNEFQKVSLKVPNMV